MLVFIQKMLKMLDESRMLLYNYIMMKKNILIISILLITFCGSSLFSQRVIPIAGCNLIVQEITNEDINLKTISKAPNWFAGVFAGVDVNNPTKFVLNMGGTEQNSPGDVTKWNGLRPVYTYAKYLDYDTYIYYTKNAEGYWVNSDPFLNETEKLAGNGPVPVQNIIPAQFAGEFLSVDGKFWSCWQEITDTSVDGMNNFHMTRKFSSPDVSIAMKYPYTYDYEAEYMARLNAANIAGVTVHNIGKSREEHELFVVEICDPNAKPEQLKDRPVVLMFSNEQGSESEGGWVINGAMNFLMSDDDAAKNILKKVSFLFIPILDPVGWSTSTYAGMTYDFRYQGTKIRPEVVAYANFINEWNGDHEKRLDIAMNILNIECNEGPNVFCPMLESNQHDEIDALNKFFLPQLEKLQGVKTSPNYWIQWGFSSNRFAGWCAYMWGAIQMSYEVNSRYPGKILPLNEMNTLGESFVTALEKYFETDEYERAYPKMEKHRASQTALRKEMLPGYLDSEERYAGKPNYDVDALRDFRIVGRGF